MTEAELRALIRERVAVQLGQAHPPVQALNVANGRGHVSHEMYVTLVNTTDACLIEPAVPCTHCGFCQSHGH